MAPLGRAPQLRRRAGRRSPRRRRVRALDGRGLGLPGAATGRPPVHRARPASDRRTNRSGAGRARRERARRGPRLPGLGVREPSPDGRLLAYSVDHDGSEVYTLRVRDLGTGADLPDEVRGTYYGLGWSADCGKRLLHDRRPRLPARTPYGGTCSAPTPPPTPWSGTSRTAGSSWTSAPPAAVLSSGWCRPVATPARCASSRPTGRTTSRRSSSPGSPGGSTSSTTNRARTAVGSSWSPTWTHRSTGSPPRRSLLRAPPTGRQLLAHDPAVRVVAADAFGDHVVVTERTEGRLRLRVLDRAGATLRLVEPAAGGEIVQLARNDEVPAPGRAGSSTVRIVREGWVRPPTVLDLDLASGAGVAGAHPGAGPRPAGLPLLRSSTRSPRTGSRCRSRWSAAASPARRGPCLLYGYGAYESCLDTEFWPDMLPLLDRGVLLAVAHVRGGGGSGGTGGSRAGCCASATPSRTSSRRRGTSSGAA